MRREGGNRAEEEVETSQIVRVSVRRVPRCRTGSRFVFLGGKSNSEEGQNRKFEKFTEQVFCEELASNTVSLHYTLREPEAYGIEHSTVTFGNFTVDGKETQASVENLQEMLKTFLYEKLDVQNRLTYDILEYYLVADGR